MTSNNTDPNQPSNQNQSNHHQSNNSDFKLSADEISRPEKPLRNGRMASTEKTSSAPKTGLLILLILAANGGLSYLLWQQKQAFTAEINELEERYMSSQSEVGNLNQELEKNANEIGSDVTSLKEAIAKANNSLNEANSEIRKLWVIAHQTNKPNIEKLTKEIKATEAKVEKQSKELSDTLKSVEKTALEIKTTQNNHIQTVENIKQQLIMTQNLSLQVSTLEETMQQIDVSKKVSALEKSIAQHKKSLAQINDHRKQVNTQIDQLTSALRKLQDPSPSGL